MILKKPEFWRKMLSSILSDVHGPYRGYTHIARLVFLNTLDQI